MADWLRDYALLALRVNRLATEKGPTGVLLDYRGPAEWATEVAETPPPPPEQLVADTERLLASLKGHDLDDQRADYLAGQLRAFQTVVRRFAGEELSLRQSARGCLDLEVDWLPESTFEAAHELLDKALPGGAGTLAERLHQWQDHHTLPPDRIDQLPGMVDQAIAETRARTNALMPLPAGEQVSCQLVSDVAFLGAGLYQGDRRGTVFINRDLPFNLADLLYVVAHEGHPGHIAEAVCKDLHLIQGKGHLEQQVWFFLSPRLVVSEGMGLRAQELIFSRDEAQAWLTDTVLKAAGIPPDGSDFAAVHHAKNILWGVWCNANLMSAEGRPDDEIRRYLADWALLRDTELTSALPHVRSDQPYIFNYFYGWRLLEPWVRDLSPAECLRRLLTEPITPNQLRQPLP